MHFFRLIRFTNIAITWLTVLFVWSLQPEADKLDSLVLAIAVVFTVMVAANTQNDLEDLAIDRLNRPDRAIVSGQVSLHLVRFISFFAYAITAILALLVPLPAAVILIVVLFLLLIYTRELKVRPLWGNVMVATVSAFALIFSALLLESSISVIYPALLAFFVQLIREIIKDLEDMQGDSHAKLRTIALIWPRQRVHVLLQLLSLGLLITIAFGFYSSSFGVLYQGLTLLALFPLLTYTIWAFRDSDKSEHEYRRLSQLIKLMMLLGLIALGSDTWLQFILANAN
jgi:geranylgeranylglycerol-phosphate geranylgeranyltransferase